MNGYSIFSKEGSAPAYRLHPLPRWRRVFIALMVALSIGSGGQLPRVQAAPAGATELRFFMIANKEGASKPVCIGEAVTLQVLVYRMKVINGVSQAPDAVTGVYVTGVVANPNIGQISPEQNTTILASAIYPGAADFVFHAKSPGETTITFVGTVGTGWFGTSWGGSSEALIADVNVRVVPCKFKVKAIQQAIIAGGGNFNIVAMIDEAEMKSDEQGHFTGTTPVNWVGAASNVGICSVSINVAATTQADLTGDMDESGQLTGNLSIEAPDTMVTATCVGVSNTSPMSLSADPLIFSVPSSGGVVTVAQGFVFETANMPGSAVIVVIPVEDEAAAFSPDSRAALPPFEWWARLWDNFPWLYNPVLALR